ncbi:hypothetical protein RMSM_06917 [Rhodopirellula maiorica SM1]|uniref:Uncharacterized protein n=1 Tax=Rhodopirellula maiorica SM1 TaxID=1265738 RepID=M5R9J0_9BACT|nr:hypothetical protein [Rhodopirellula maiorica]EMI16163.1 hypothetical protein RMSM_06917 [Rhodopirellula maiorica SM1]
MPVLHAVWRRIVARRVLMLGAVIIDDLLFFKMDAIEEQFYARCVSGR